jgi:hypothetical protein
VKGARRVQPLSDRRQSVFDFEPIESRHQAGAKATDLSCVHVERAEIYADIREPHQGVDMNQESHTLTIALPSDERVASPGCDLNVAGAKSIDETLAHCFSFSNLTQLFGLK